MGKMGMAAAAAAVIGALALQGCDRGGRDSETQAAPPMTNTVIETTNTTEIAPAANTTAPAPVVSTGGADAQMQEDAAASGMTARTGSSRTTSTTTVTTHTTSTEGS